MGYDLREKVVLITGASSGIGLACTREFHNAGARVVAVARSQDKLEALVAELGTDRAVLFVADITDPAQRRAAVNFAVSRFDTIDVLLNNAGWASFSSIARMPSQHLDSMIQLNFVAPLELIQMVLPILHARGTGQIINISSVVGAQPFPRMVAYSATKAAVDALTTGLRMELRGTGIDVLLVSPGSTDTPFFTAAASVDARAVRMNQAQYSPQRVARAVVRSSRSRRREVTLTPAGRLICFIRRLSHPLADRLIHWTAQRAMPAEDP